MTEPSATPVPARTTVVLAIAGDRRRAEAATILEGAPDLDLAATTADGADAIARIGAVVPDVAIIDIDLPTPDGLAVCAEVAERFPVVRTVLVSPADDERCYEGVAAGAVGCRFASELRSQLLVTARRTAWGESTIPRGWATRLLADAAAPSASAQSHAVPPPALSATEREVLSRIASGATPEAIAALHQVPVRVVNLHAAYAVAKFRQMHRDRRHLPASS